MFIVVIAIVGNWDTKLQALIKATRDLSQPENSPVCNSIVFALFEQKYDVYSVENILNRSYPRFASTTTTTTAHTILSILFWPIFLSVYIFVHMLCHSGILLHSHCVKSDVGLIGKKDTLRAMTRLKYIFKMIDKN